MKLTEIRIGARLFFFDVKEKIMVLLKLCAVFVVGMFIGAGLILLVQGSNSRSYDDEE